jgi:CheY-like chemotaxis protein
MNNVAPSPGPPLILVADDEDGVRSFLSAALPRQGYRALCAADGDEALCLYLEHAGQVRAALLDVRMPGRDGPAALAALRRLSPGLPCAFMTGDPGRYGADDLRAAGVAHVLAKPFSLADLGRVLRELCGGAR